MIENPSDSKQGVRCNAIIVCERQLQFLKGTCHLIQSVTEENDVFKLQET